MTTEFDMSEFSIPYGALHDQVLRKISLEDDTFVFTFAIRLYPEDYPEEIYRKYAHFQQCEMRVKTVDEPLNSFLLETAADRHGRYKGLCLNESGVTEALNHAGKVTFLSCAAANGAFLIELSTEFGHAKGKYGRYKRYGICRISLDAVHVKWEWF